MYLLIKNILLSKKIILLQSYLQVLNFKELIESKKKIKNLNDAVILTHNINKSYAENLKKLLTKLDINNFHIVCHDEHRVKIIYYILRLRKFFSKNFELVISGNANSYLDREFIYLSNNSIIIDDGTNVFENKFQKLNFKNCLIFSAFESNYFKKFKYELNEYSYLKKKLKNISGYSNEIYILGTPFVEIYKLKKSYYINLLKRVFLHLKLNNKVIYIPHPKENPLYLKYHFKNLKILKLNCPAELYFLSKSKIPRTIVSFRSTALIILNKISERFRLLNLSENKNSITTNLSKFKFNKIDQYLKKLGIQTKII